MAPNAGSGSNLSAIFQNMLPQLRCTRLLGILRNGCPICEIREDLRAPARYPSGLPAPPENQSLPPIENLQ